MKDLIQALKGLAQKLAQGLEDGFEWLTDRWYRAGTYFSLAFVGNILALTVDFSWFWLASSVAALIVGAWLTRVAWLNEQDMRARVEEALKDVDFQDTSRWIKPGDEDYPERPER